MGGIPQVYACLRWTPSCACAGWQVEGGPGCWVSPGREPQSPCLSLACPHQQGLVCISSKLRLAERRQQRLREVQAKRNHLCEELAETQGRLMVEPGRWLEQCECPMPSPPKPQTLLPFLAS